MLGAKAFGKMLEVICRECLSWKKNQFTPQNSITHKYFGNTANSIYGEIKIINYTITKIIKQYANFITYILYLLY